ncbi:MAG TPA: NAD(P)H-binding protein [Pseudonocardiaceae bacterium]|nr:NAD(P)H-binding protein [Pseudonocardiaceae bacterium]
MRLVVLGAAGGTGRLVVERAITAGHEVTAVARDCEALARLRLRSTVVRADVLEPETLRAPIEGADAVVYAVAPPNRSTTVVYSEGIRNLLETMRDSGVKRLLTITSSRIEVPREAPLTRKLVIRYLIEKIFRNPYLDMLRMEDELRHSDMNWTMVRSAKLRDGTEIGRYRTVINGYLPRERPLNRADLAEFLVTHIDDADTFRAEVSISG